MTANSDIIDAELKQYFRACVAWRKEARAQNRIDVIDDAVNELFGHALHTTSDALRAACLRALDSIDERARPRQDATA